MINYQHNSIGWLDYPFFVIRDIILLLHSVNKYYKHQNIVGYLEDHCLRKGDPLLLAPYLIKEINMEREIFTKIDICPLKINSKYFQHNLFEYT